MKIKQVLALLLVCALALCSLSSALAAGISLDTAVETDGERLLRGYDSSAGYVYLTFGNYPFTKEGETRPCLWRVLSVDNDYAFLLNEYVLDFKRFHSEKVDQPDWSDYELYATMNTTMAADMFTDAERSALRYTEELGWLFILNNKEFMTKAYGFRPILTEVEPERECAPTPWAMQQPGSYIHENGNTWYWSRTCRHTAEGGYEHILGYNGHISMSGFLRVGGIRPACFVDCSRLDQASGSGTVSDPYVFSLTD